MRDFERPYVIAEIGCNHKGDMGIAKDLVQIAAKFCKVDAVKFQKRCNRELLTEEQYNAPHPNPVNSYGKTYGEHREFLEFSLDQHRQLKEWCEECGVVYSTSVWDMTSAKEIASLKPKFIKIPSASNNNYSMLQWLCDNYQGEIQLSFGMTTHQEEEKIVELFTKSGRNQDLIIYACTSGYPVPYENIALKEITRLREKYGKDVKTIGFSGHHLGIYVDMAAYALRYSPSFKGSKKPSAEALIKLAQANQPSSKVGWEGNFNDMALKTVIRRLLSKYGYLSVEMQNALSKDVEDSQMSRNDLISENANGQAIELDTAQYEEVDTETGEIKESEAAPAENAEEAPSY